MSKEPKAWITVNGNHIPIYEDGYESEKNDTRSSIETKVKKRMAKVWKESEFLQEHMSKDTMERVDKILGHFEESGEDMIQPSADYEDEIVWRFSGKDKETGDHAGFEFEARPDEKSAKEALHGNGYTVSNGLVFPKALFNYLIDKTNMDEADIEAVKFVAKQALSDYKKRR